jgi:S-adenosyl methyltransferase
MIAAVAICRVSSEMAAATSQGKEAEMSELADVPPGVDPTRPSPARLYDYFLGGTNNFPVDRQAAEYLRTHIPDVVDALWANRGFHGRAAVWMARQGIQQFLDIGSGLPTQNNTHESVQKVAPGARVVYVDNDPMVAAHAGTLLAGGGTTAVILADLRDPDALLSHPDLLQLIDFAEPVGVLMTDVMHFLPDGDDPWGLVARYMAAMVPGSCLALSHGTNENLPPRQTQATEETMAQATENVYPRSRADVQRFFDGLELLPPYDGAEPAVTYAGLGGAEDPEAADSDGSRGFYCGVARRVGTAPRRG